MSNQNTNKRIHKNEEKKQDHENRTKIDRIKRSLWSSTHHHSLGRRGSRSEGRPCPPGQELRRWGQGTRYSLRSPCETPRGEGGSCTSQEEGRLGRDRKWLSSTFGGERRRGWVNVWGDSLVNVSGRILVNGWGERWGDLNQCLGRYCGEHFSKRGGNFCERSDEILVNVWRKGRAFGEHLCREKERFRWTFLEKGEVLVNVYGERRRDLSERL